MVFSIHNIYISILFILLFTIPMDGLLPYGSVPTYWVLLGTIFWAKSLQKKVSKSDIAILLFGISMSISTLINFNEVDFLHVQSYALVVITYFVVRSVNVRQNLESTLYSIFLIFIFASFFSLLYQYYAKIHTAGIVNASFLLDSHLLAFLTCVSYAFIQSRNLSNRKVFLTITVVLISSVIILLSASRAGLISFTVLNFALIFYYMKFNIRYIFYSIFIIALFYLFFINMGFILDLFEVVFGSVDSIHIAQKKFLSFFNDSSVNERYKIWLAPINRTPIEIAQMLIVGIGPGGYLLKYSANVHNLLLDLLFSLGLVGFGSILYLLFYSIRVSLYRQTDKFLNALGFCLLVSLVFCMFHDFGRSRYIWVLMGLITSIYSNLPQRNSK